MAFAVEYRPEKRRPHPLWDEGRKQRPQERQFLALTPGECLQWFLRSLDERYGPHAKERPTKNFVIRKKGKG
jgi:hypothetical protein